MADKLRFRQIHLDFHTSPDIDGIGADFDPEEFAATLEKARVDSVTAFARCHHGLIYYQSEANKERIHPHLARPNLLPEQIEACHKRGIRVPIYTTVQWDDYTADEHRDWLHIDEDGKEFNTPPLKPGFYRFLDVFHPGYRQFLYTHVAELFSTMPVDGLFFDIVQPRPSLAKHWLDAMDNAGVNPEDTRARQLFSQKVIHDWEREMTEFIRERSRDCTIFYNSGHVGPRHRPTTNAYSHYELESLPSGGWGYLHFPQAMRYARTLPNDCLGMTGKFHTSWGDFSSYKNGAALEFECFHMLALGAKCSVGDQLPPRGVLDRATYELIGGVYTEVERKEPFCRGVEAVADIAVLSTEEFTTMRPAFDARSDRDQPAVMGALRMLQELRHQFNIVDSEADFSLYKVLVLPDDVPVNDELSAKIEAFVGDGGRVLASHKSGLNLDGTAFNLPSLPVSYKGDAPFSPDFLVPGEELDKALGAGEYVMYKKAVQTEPTAMAKALASVNAPYFNRTWRHYCSHRHTPSAGTDAGYPAVVQKSGVIYLAHPVFAEYHASAPRWCKTLVGELLQRLLPQPFLVVDGPSTLLAALNYQPAENRHVLHLLHYIPERRGQAFDVLEDVIPLYNVPVRVAAQDAQSVQIVPSGAAVQFSREDGYISFVVPEINGHTMLTLS